MSSPRPQLHWTQRVALVRHNLHAASRSGDFCFFKTLQAAEMMEGANHVATLSAAMGDDADLVLAAMDNLNSGLAYVHQDAFKNVYDNLKSTLSASNDGDTDRANLYVDITIQKNIADMAIDKVAGSVIALIEQQPVHVQNDTAAVWITGATIIADCMEIVIQQMDSLEMKLDDFIRLEESWNTVKASVACSITGLKGVFSLMDPTELQPPEQTPSRSTSVASGMFRRFSNAFASPPSPTSTRSASVASNYNAAGHTRNGSVSSISSLTSPVYRTSTCVRAGVSNGCPTALPVTVNWESHRLSAIPPTPAALEHETDPFDTSVPPMPFIPIIPIAMVVGKEQHAPQQGLI